MKITKSLYTKLQDLFIQETGLKVNDIVEVTMEFARFSGGLQGELDYDSDWDDIYDKHVQVDSIGNEYITVRDEDRYAYNVPFFILSAPILDSDFVNSKEYDEEIGGYQTILYNDRIEVGCQRISYEQIDRLLEAIKEFRAT